MTKGAWQDDWQRAADEKAALEARIAELEGLLIDAEGLLCDPQGGPASVEMAERIRVGLGINTEAKQ